MSAAVATPASLGPWSTSQRKAASRIFAQALLSALPSVPRNKESRWKTDKSPLKVVVKEQSVANIQYDVNNSYDFDDDDDEDYDDDISYDAAYSSYTESDYGDSTYFEEV